MLLSSPTSCAIGGPHLHSLHHHSSSNPQTRSHDHFPRWTAPLPMLQLAGSAD
ncbi:hypothetical protein PAHAL_J053300 [Panicum hallii]|uniref:Uncharacterized protein n=1 Tax=Panicum hallii TaxID=206008 RepID=A0A2T7AA12_9POAL|nr:hypothetical protein PAHAL_J053300 [Panicum hallii]